MRIIKFQGIPNKKYKEMIDSVIGQLSDGIWENCNLNGYWVYAYGSSDGTDIIIDEKYRDWENDYKSGYKNPYYNMSDSDILRYYAKKIKQIALDEMEDNSTSEKPFVKKGKFKPDDSYKLVYLSADECITLMDAYELYELLMSKSKEDKSYAGKNRKRFNMA